MSIWSILGAILPWTSLVTLLAMLYFQRSAAVSRAKATALSLELSAAQLNLKILQAQIAQMTTDYTLVKASRETAEQRAYMLQCKAAELAYKVANNPDAEDAARALAEQLREMLNGT
jgi:lipopolysaccharide export LptBFGC system permease protein LptF